MKLSVRAITRGCGKRTCGVGMRTGMITLAIALGWATALCAEPLTGGLHTVVVAGGDTLRSLAARVGVDPSTIASDNGLDVDARLRVQTVLRIDNRHIVPTVTPETSIVVNVPQRMLFAMTGTGTASYPVAVGRADWPTPLGEFSIVSKEENPTWDVPESIREEARRAGRSLPLKVPPGPSNPLGAYWLGLSIGSVGIHGTNAPTSVYQRVTHGCIRLHPEDIAALFPQVYVGTKGKVIYEPVLVAVDGDEVFVEAHRDVYGLGPRDALEFVRLRTRELDVFERVDWSLAADVILRRAGIARAVTRRGD